ncbi:thiamine biosynthesis protein ThiC [Erythrobacter sp. Alg231-14]|uniref:thiamine biosynthesis protein ThiC n=1 Tax=Erythrobacter sp. Alg231-14 TaxID=1922225 RepID=UPI000D556952
MELTQGRTVKIIAYMLIALAVSQPIYTALFLVAPDVDRLFMWRFEAVIFVLLAALSMSAAITAKQFALGFSAIALAALLKLLAVGLGLTQFWPFAAVGEANADLAEVATSVVALSFFSYNAGNILLGLAAVVLGTAKSRAGGSIVGRATTIVGALAILANALVMMFGFQGAIPSPVGGATGVLASVLIGLCMFSINPEE